MKTLLLIFVLLFGGVSSLYARFKRTMAANGTLNDGSESQSFSSGETGGDFFDFDSIGAEEAIPTQREYFSYEDAVAGEEVRPVEKVMQEEPAQVLRPAFDLRQAVIYQTLLNNQYITGLGK